MIRTLRSVARNRSGATAAEFAMTLPLFLAFVFVFFGIGAVFWANAGLRHSVGEGARMATLFPLRSNTAIANTILDNSFGLGGVMTQPTITPGTANGQNFVDITVTVNPRFNLFFIEVEPITMTETRRVYRPA
ncbi:TadE/TadG family type IV pilus assembly protein [Sandarakinorhabdus sp.]|jgi:Flp pilus assembly protein TadG|uniref:TadE/TadG family type IV pilus assembly protein n=1 Tax=Sandarakinorhabdus sp. TaxID=1916663 RepID=UPI0028A8416C|nr:TadE/TadG family type IV pilus assembly protein [Sandarakinorhabdus sp.]